MLDNDFYNTIESCNELKNDINILFLSCETAIKTLHKVEKNEISVSDGNIALLTLNNYDSPEEYKVESGNENNKESLIKRITAFIIKVYQTIKNAIITLFKKVRTIYYNFTKQAYKIETEINQGHFEFTDETMKIVLRDLIYGYGVNDSNPVDNFINYVKSLSATWMVQNLDFDKASYENFLSNKVKYSEYTNTQIINDLNCNVYLNINDRNTFLSNVKKPNNVKMFVGYNPRHKLFYTIEDDKGLLKLAEMSMKDYEVDENKFKFDISTFGKILKVAKTISGDLEGCENRISNFLKISQDAIFEYKNDLRKNPDINTDLLEVYCSTSFYHTQKICNMITESIIGITTTTSYMLRNMESEIFRKTKG